MEFYLATVGQLCKWLVDCIFYEMQVTNNNRQYDGAEMKSMYPLGCVTKMQIAAEEDFNVFCDYFMSIDYSDWVVEGETFYLDELEEGEIAKRGSFFMFYRESTRRKYIPVPYMMP